MPERPSGAPQPAPIIKDVRRANCPFVIGKPDANGNRELSFIVGPMEMETFTISPEGADEFLKGFSGGIVPADLSDIPPTPLER